MCDNPLKKLLPKAAEPAPIPTPTPAIVPGFSFGASDVRFMACTLYGECRGEPHEGQVAVAWVIRNRASRRRFVTLPGTEGAVKAACLAPWQFSCWNANDPNMPLLRSMAEYAGQPKELVRLEVVALGVLEGRIDDPTNGGDHYHTITQPSWAKAWPPEWAPTMAECARFGGHVFYNSTRGR